jgi:hypothetical protein
VRELRQRRPPVKRRRRQSRTEREAERGAQELFKATVLRLDFGICIGADRLGFDHECSGDKQAHHAVPQKVLRDHISKLELSESEIIEWLWDPGNGATICDGLHDPQAAKVRHAKPFWIPLEWLPARNADWARDREIFHLLIREHPPLFAEGVRSGESG